MSGNGIYVDAIFGYVQSYRNTLRRKHAQRVLNNLPAHLRKDIGWPDSHRFSGTD